MTHKAYNILVISALAASLMLLSGINIAVNLFGTFRDARGRSIVISGEERYAKFLMSYNYIPSNFDGILLGPSTTDNWDTSRLHCEKIYNGSINGGNISEAYLIAKNVLLHRPLKLIIVTIDPYLTETYGRKEGGMNRNEYWSALGSIRLFEAYGERVAIRLGLMAEYSSAYGQFRFVVRKPALRRAGNPEADSSDFRVDERAMAQYGELLREARKSGSRIVGIIPIRRKMSLSRAAALGRYDLRVERFFLKNEIVIDLNKVSELDSFPSDSSNFQDDVHYSTPGADKVVAILDRELSNALKSRLN